MSEYVFRTEEPIEYCYNCPINNQEDGRCRLGAETSGCEVPKKCPLKELPPQDNPWHTGEPTDEGDYRVAFAYDGDVFFEILHWSYNWSWYDERHQIIAWQKIEPYKENWKKNDN